MRVRPPPPAPSESLESLDLPGFSGLFLSFFHDGLFCGRNREKEGNCAVCVSEPAEVDQEANFILGRGNNPGFCWLKPPWSCSPDGCTERGHEIGEPLQRNKGSRLNLYPSPYPGCSLNEHPFRLGHLYFFVNSVSKIFTFCLYCAIISRDESEG